MLTSLTAQANVHELEADVGQIQCLGCRVMRIDCAIHLVLTTAWPDSTEAMIGNPVSRTGFVESRWGQCNPGAVQGCVADSFKR